MDSPAGPVPPEGQPGQTPSPRSTVDRNALLARGIAWSGAFQVFVAGITFLSMLALVRLLSPAEFGRATAAVGILALINCFNCSYFIAHALQLHEGEEPDWAAHWRAGIYIQLALFVVCNAVAGAAWLLPSHRAIAPLLHVASVGLLIDCPNQLALTMVRRSLDYPTLRLIQAAATTTMVIASVSLGFLGAGAFALVIGSNVLQGVPQGVYLLFVRKWRPPMRWWGWPDWESYRPALRFGAVVSGGAVMSAARGMLEALVLPPAIGYAAVGLLNRAQVLFSTTVGRVNTLLLDTVYPLLPRSAGDPPQFARHATLFVQTMLLMSIPGGVFVGLAGPTLSRLLYGATWSAADPLIWPGTILAWGVATTLIFSAVLQARSRLRLAFTCNVASACACLPALVIVLLDYPAVTYAWALAGGQVTAAAIAACLAQRELQPRWFIGGLGIPAFVAVAAGIAVVVVGRCVTPTGLLATVLVDTAVFVIVSAILMRVVFADRLREIILRLPGCHFLSAVLRYR